MKRATMVLLLSVSFSRFTILQFARGSQLQLQTQSASSSAAHSDEWKINGN